MRRQRPPLGRLLKRAPHHAGVVLHRAWALTRHFLLGDARPIQAHAPLFEGRRVAIVGNAESLLGTRFGAQIDAMDVVVRINHGVVRQPVSQGRRTDVLAMSCRMLETDLLQHFDPALILWMTPRWRHLQPYSRRVMQRVCFFPGRAWRHLSQDLLGGRRPSTGFMTTMQLLQLDIAAEIHLFGFDFGVTRTFYNAPGYQTPHDYAAEARLLSAQVACGRLVIHHAPTTATETGP